MEFIKGLQKLGFKSLIVASPKKIKVSKDAVSDLTDDSVFYNLKLTNDYEVEVVKVFAKNTLISLS